MKILIAVLTYLQTTEAFFTNRVLGLADLTLQHMKPCANATKDTFMFELEQRKYNRTTYVWKISLDTKYLVDDSVIAEVNLSSKTQGGYKKRVFYIKLPLCQTMRALIGNVYKQFLQKAVGVDDCPIPPGSYSMDDFYFDNTQFTIPQLYGEYMLTLFLYKDEQPIYCGEAYYELNPKE